MDLEFPEIIERIQKIKHERVGRKLIDAEVAAMQCAWESISYPEFIREQVYYTGKFKDCYVDPLRSKTPNTISGGGSKIFKILSEHFGIRLTQKNFTKTIQELLSETAKNDSVLNQTQSKEVPETVLSEDVQSSKQPTKNSIVISQDIEGVIQHLGTAKLVLSIYGAPGSGKTTLINYISRHFEQNHGYKSIYTDLRYLDSFTQWAFEVLAQAHIEQGTEEENFSKLFELFNSINVLLFIDSIVHLDHKLQAFIEAFALRNISSKSRVIISSQRNIQLNIPDSLLGKYQVGGLKDQENIHQYFTQLGLKNPDYWNKMANFYGGNYREIKYAGEFIRDFFNGDVGSYWRDGTRIISQETIQEYESIEFTQLDKRIFSMFAGSGEHIISQSIRKALSRDSSSSEYWARIHHLSDIGYLVQSRSIKTNTVSYSIAPLLKSYLVMKKIIEPDLDVGENS